MKNWQCRQMALSANKRRRRQGKAPRGTRPWRADALQRAHAASRAGGAPGTSMTRISRLPSRQLSPSARATSIAGMRARSAAGPTTLAPYRRFSSSLPPTWSLPQYHNSYISLSSPAGRSSVLLLHVSPRGAALQHSSRRSIPRPCACIRGRLLVHRPICARPSALLLPRQLEERGGPSAPVVVRVEDVVQREAPARPPTRR